MYSGLKVLEVMAFSVSLAVAVADGAVCTNNRQTSRPSVANCATGKPWAMPACGELPQAARG